MFQVTPLFIRTLLVFRLLNQFLTLLFQTLNQFLTLLFQTLNQFLTLLFSDSDPDSDPG